MPGPPTPVTACPLNQLEILNGHARRIYDSTQQSNELTLTLEGQRSIDATATTLDLLIHAGTRRMLSVKLSDLASDYRQSLDCVSVNMQLRQLRIKIKEQNHTLNADFSEKRDFHVTICMLKQSGFTINHHTDGIENARRAAPSSPVLTLEPNTGLGPRLSAITPLQGFEPLSYQTQSMPTLGDLNHSLSSLNYPLMASQSSSQPLQHVSDSLCQSEPQITSHMTQLNPYNVFLGRQYSDYRPRISSPLKNSIHDPFTTDHHASLSQGHGTLMNPRLLSQRESLEHGPSLEQQSNHYGKPRRPNSFGLETPANTDNDKSNNQLEWSVPEPSIQQIKAFSVDSCLADMPQPRQLPFLKRSNTCASRSYSGNSPGSDGVESLKVGNNKRSWSQNGEPFASLNSTSPVLPGKRAIGSCNTVETTEKADSDPFSWLDEANAERLVSDWHSQPLKHRSSPNSQADTPSSVTKRGRGRPKKSTSATATMPLAVISPNAKPNRSKPTRVSKRSPPTIQSSQGVQTPMKKQNKLKKLKLNSPVPARLVESVNNTPPIQMKRTRSSSQSSHQSTPVSKRSSRRLITKEIEEAEQTRVPQPPARQKKHLPLVSPAQSSKEDKAISQASQTKELLNTHEHSILDLEVSSLVVTRSHVKVQNAPITKSSSCENHDAASSRVGKKSSKGKGRTAPIKDGEPQIDVPTVPVQASASKKRKFQVCVPCRQKRRRCDRQLPCGRCQLFGKNCVYESQIPGTNNDTSLSPQTKEGDVIHPKSNLAKAQAKDLDGQKSNNGPPSDVTPIIHGPVSQRVSSPVSSEEDNSEELHRTDSQDQPSLLAGDRSLFYEEPLLVTDEMLRRVNETTSSLFDQYEADIKEGYDKEERASYYMDRIMSARTRFWHQILVEIEGTTLPMAR